jgi:5-methylcytosine-specific restriction endonuclease McrBC regulatory subunit McrC
MNVLTLREHETFAIGETFSVEGKKSVTHAQVDALERLSQRLKAAKGGLFTHANRTTLKTRQYVGVVQLGAEAIEIIPKIDGLDEQGTRTKPAWIIDTKWKRLDEQERNQGIAQADVYQMLGYAHRYGARDVFLLYPHHAGIGCETGLQRSFHILGGVSENGAKNIHVACVDLKNLHTVPEQLRSILEGVASNLIDSVGLFAELAH